MKRPPWLFEASLATVFVAFVGAVTVAQDRNRWPPDLNQHSSVVEIVSWLDKTSFPQARVGIRTNSLPAVESLSPVLSQDQRPPESRFYSQGFRLVAADGCSLTLRNDDARLIAHSDLVPINLQEHYSADLYVPLSRLSDRKGRAPNRHTNKPEKSQLLGTWRTEFKSNRSREDVVLKLSPKSGTEKPVIWEAETLTFTFDSKGMSQNFDAAFRQAIRLCKRK
jgi:hypothetical protein